MKVEATKVAPPPSMYRPVSVTLTFETERELLAFRDIFNTSKICEVLYEEGIKPDDVRQALDAQHNLYLQDGPVFRKLNPLLIR